MSSLLFVTPGSEPRFVLAHESASCKKPVGSQPENFVFRFEFPSEKMALSLVCLKATTKITFQVICYNLGILVYLQLLIKSKK